MAKESRVQYWKGRTIQKSTRFLEKKVHEVWVGNYLMTPFFFLENDLEVKKQQPLGLCLEKKHIRDGHGMK